MDADRCRERSSAVAPGIEECERLVKQHVEALDWCARASAPLALAWLPYEAGRRPSKTALTDQKSAMRIVLAEIFHREAPSTEALRALYLSHTPLGRPRVRWRGEAAVWARAHGLSARRLHISYTHDGGALIAGAAYAPGLCGLGVDVVHLPRLRRADKDANYLHRFARRFMSDEEYAAFVAASEKDDPEMLMRRTAAHFSLMEATSKALGVGLKIGGGLGRSASLPLQSIHIGALTPTVRFLLGSEAERRCQTLGGDCLEGHWGANREYLLSAVMLWKRAK